MSVDVAIMSATRRGERFVDGYVVACHGLDMQTAEHLDPLQLTALGVGAQLGRKSMRQQGREMVSLGDAGCISPWTP